MELVINANIMFSIANPISKTRDLISNFPLNLYAPKFAKEEIIKYKREISKKANLTNFNSFLEILNTRINFINLEQYQDEMQICKNIIEDEKDIEYLALAIKLKMPLWTNDKLLKDQNLVKIIATSELITILNKE